MNIFEKLLISIIAFLAVGMGYIICITVSPFIGIPVGAAFIIAILAGITHKREYND